MDSSSKPKRRCGRVSLNQFKNARNTVVACDQMPNVLLYFVLNKATLAAEEAAVAAMEAAKQQLEDLKAQRRQLQEMHEVSTYRCLLTFTL